MTEKTLVSLRLPSELVSQFDQIADYLERDRTWVILQALKQYMAEGEEGADLLDEAIGYAELERGERIPLADVLEDARRLIDETIAEKKRAS